MKRKFVRISTKAFLVMVSFFVCILVGNAYIAQAITNGEPDGYAHPYVGLLVFDIAPGQPGWRCSGVLIAPNVVLTAGHCTDGAVAARVWFDGEVADDNLYPLDGTGSGAIEGIPYTNPDFRSEENPYGGGNGLPAFSYRDVGVVVLDEAADIDYDCAELPEAGLVDTLKNKTELYIVGYGFQYQAQIPGNWLPQPPPHYRWAGPMVRMYARSMMVSGKFVNSEEFIRISLNPGGGKGGSCFGDSGGPTLKEGEDTDIILAVNSFATNNNCTGVGYSSRIDIPEVLDWINGFLD